MVIPWEVVFDRGGWALAGVCVLCVIFGLLVPRRTIRDYQQTLERERARNDLVADVMIRMLSIIEKQHQKGSKDDD